MDTAAKNLLKEKLIKEIQETENIDIDAVKKKIYSQKQLTTKEKQDIVDFATELDTKKRTSFTTKFVIADNTFVYNFDEMSIDRIFTAKQLFSMEQEYIKHLPNNPEEMKVLAKRQATRTAFAAILMKKTDDGYERYNINDDAFDALAMITGKDYEKLQKCKEDFFLRTSMQDNEQLALLRSTIDQLKGIDPSSLEMLLGAALQATDVLAENS